MDNGDVAVFQVDASNMLHQKISIVRKSTSYRFVVYLKLREKKQKRLRTKLNFVAIPWPEQDATRRVVIIQRRTLKIQRIKIKQVGCH